MQRRTILFCALAIASAAVFVRFGLWQVRRTREPQTDFQEWIRYDLEYVQHSSLKLDLWIIMLTIRKIIGG